MVEVSHPRYGVTPDRVCNSEIPGESAAILTSTLGTLPIRCRISRQVRSFLGRADGVEASTSAITMDLLPKIVIAALPGDSPIESQNSK